MQITNTSKLTTDLISLFDSSQDVSKYISQSKLDYISRFKGLVLVLKGNTDKVDLSNFDIIDNSYLKIFNSDLEFIYERFITELTFGEEDVDQNILNNVEHGDYIIIQFQTRNNQSVSVTPALLWINNRISSVDILKSVKYDLDKFKPQLQTNNEIFINTDQLDYIVYDSDRFQSTVNVIYLAGELSRPLSYTQILNNIYSETTTLTQLNNTILPKTGWYVFEQIVLNKLTNTVTKYSLDFDQVRGVGLSRLTYANNKSLFIDLTNKNKALNQISEGDITTSENRNIRLEGWLVYRKTVTCINRNISTALGNINVPDLSTAVEDCDDLLSSSLFGNLANPDTFDSEIFLGINNPLAVCAALVNSLVITPAQRSDTTNRNISTCSLNVEYTSFGYSFNNNNARGFGVALVQFTGSAVNINTSSFSSIVIIGDALNYNSSSAEGLRGILSGFGICNNTNTNETISNVPTLASTINTFNRNVSRAALTNTKGFIANTINTNNSTARSGKTANGFSITANINTSTTAAGRRIISDAGNSTHLNISTAEGLYAKAGESTINHYNISSVDYIDIDYKGVSNTVNINTSTSKSVAYILAPLGTSDNVNYLLIID